jgi:hypothetical protein
MRAMTMPPTPPVRPTELRRNRKPSARASVVAGRDAFRLCWCTERRGKPLPGCRDCGGGGMALVRFPVPR